MRFRLGYMRAFYHDMNDGIYIDFFGFSKITGHLITDFSTNPSAVRCPDWLSVKLKIVAGVFATLVVAAVLSVVKKFLRFALIILLPRGHSNC